MLWAKSSPFQPESATLAKATIASCATTTLQHLGRLPQRQYLQPEQRCVQRSCGPMLLQLWYAAARMDAHQYS